MTKSKQIMKIAAMNNIMFFHNKSFMMSMKNLWKGLIECTINKIQTSCCPRSEEGEGQLEYDHHSNADLELLTSVGHPEPEDLDLFTFNNAELYITEPGDNTHFDQFEFEVCSTKIRHGTYLLY